ncbi:FUSC family protein [Zunongwangia endophytica]|uniref:FUSC family protein n=1 Tax=Zunongwangia endophytica TaxID=1808945 RepID=A0ABV8HC33_9FLAO|nr:FUSC family protein [Zunongwangia endophytica]MDN3594152.1 FUSC family protein [Zunongwangia endophytica]
MTKNKLTEVDAAAGKKKASNSKIINAMLIGVCIGIIVYSIFNNTMGLATLIPLFLIYKLVNTSK